MSCIVQPTEINVAPIIIPLNLFLTTTAADGVFVLNTNEWSCDKRITSIPNFQIPTIFISSPAEYKIREACSIVMNTSCLWTLSIVIDN